MNENIDFVILWVDGNDVEWQKKRNRYKKAEIGNSNGNNRYRDWELLKYWFRGVENFAPWVNKIHFVTCGQIPKWLNINNPKINIVNHEDFIPNEFLPTFNSNVIQYYLHKIPQLSERFVMFDDDQFILKSVKKSDFFINGKACDVYAENPFFSSIIGDVYPHCLLNNIQCINQYYDKRSIYKKSFFKYFNLKYGLKNTFHSLCLLPWKNFVGIYSPHICQAYSKKYFELFWKYCEKGIVEYSKNKFRETTDFSTFLVRYLQLVEGDFVPRKDSFGKRLELSNNNNKIYKSILNQKYHILCINDSNENIDFGKEKKELNYCFNKILPNKSNFEI